MLLTFCIPPIRFLGGNSENVEALQFDKEPFYENVNQ